MFSCLSRVTERALDDQNRRSPGDTIFVANLQTLQSKNFSDWWGPNYSVASFVASINSNTRGKRVTLERWNVVLSQCICSAH